MISKRNGVFLVEIKNKYHDCKVGNYFEVITAFKAITSNEVLKGLEKMFVDVLGTYYLFISTRNILCFHISLKQRCTTHSPLMSCGDWSL